MWNLNKKYLQDGEIIEYEDRAYLLGCIFSYIWAGLMLFTAVIVNIPKLSIFYVLLASPALYRILKIWSTRYAITNMRLVTRKGILTDTIKSVPYEHITAIEVSESIIGRLLKYAHLTIETSGSGGGIEINWKFLKAAYKVKKLMNEKILLMKKAA